MSASGHYPPIPDATPVSVAYGDGVGPEVMDAALRILREAYANISIEVIEAGGRVYERGAAKGVYNADIESLRRTRLLLLGPTLAPPGFAPVREAVRARFGLTREIAPVTPFPEYAQAMGYLEDDAERAAFANGGVALFESLQPAQPEWEGRNQANPSGMLHAALLLLRHIGDAANARRIHNAWLRTIEDGVFTRGMREPGARGAVGTREFADAVIERFGC
jgi:isocitrate/isopropylmalate dehydrogenase